MTQMLASFRKPFAQQVAAFRLRLADLRGTNGWKDVWQAEHDRAFMVAGAMKAELLADLGAAVEKSIAAGGTLEEFRRDFRAIVEKNGWHGWKGEGTKGGEAWRTRVIYRTNMATSYAAGRWAQVMEAGFPFIVYSHGNAAEPRLQHLAWDGVILPADHPFWATHAPPNGWGCTCYVSGARSEAGAKRLGGIPGKTLPEGWQALDPRTGAPVGISKGWAYAPGASVSRLISAMVPKLEALPQPLAVALMKSYTETERFAEWLADPKGIWPLVKISEEDAIAIGAKGRIASLSKTSLTKQKTEHGELQPEEYLDAQNVVDNARWRLTDTDPQSGTTSRIYILNVPNAVTGGYVLVVKATLSGEGLFVTSLRRMSRSELRRNEEIRRLLRTRQRGVLAPEKE